MGVFLTLVVVRARAGEVRLVDGVLLVAEEELGHRERARDREHRDARRGDAEHLHRVVVRADDALADRVPARVRGDGRDAPEELRARRLVQLRQVRRELLRHRVRPDGTSYRTNGQRS